MNWVDVVALVILGWGAVHGFRQGFVRTFLRLAGYLAAAVFAAFYSFPLVELLDRRVGLVSPVRGLLERYLPLPASMQALNLPAQQFADPVLWINRLSLPPVLADVVARYLGATGGPALPRGITGTQVIYQLLAAWVLASLAFILLLWAGRVLINLVVGILSRMVSLSPLGGLDRVAGLLAGLAYSGGVLAVAFGLLAPLATVEGLGPLTGPLLGSRAAAYFGQLFQWLLAALWKGFKS